MTTKELEFGTYEDPLSMRLPQLMCGCCGSRNLHNYRRKVQADIDQGMTLENAYKKNNIRLCCRTCIQSDFVLPNITYNPLAIEGKVEVEHLTEKEMEEQSANVRKEYIGNMKRTKLKVEKVPLSYTYLGGTKKQTYTYNAVDEEGKILASFAPPVTDNYQPAVVEWLEIPISGLSTAVTVEDSDNGSTPKRILVPKITVNVDLSKFRTGSSNISH